MAAPVVLEAEDSAFTLTTRIEVDDDSLAATMLPSGAFVVLETALDDALEAEGWARDLVRLVQDERKAAGLHVGDRIRLELRVPQDKDAWTGAHLDLIKREVGCVDASVVADPAVKEPTATVEKVAETRESWPSRRTGRVVGSARPMSSVWPTPLLHPGPKDELRFSRPSPVMSSWR